MAALFCVIGGGASANCGQAVCAVNTDWEAQGVGAAGEGTRFDLRYEFIDQDQPRAGDRKVGLGEIARHHDEVRTINRNWIATLDHALDAHWGLSISLPFLSRSHNHIHNHQGEQIPETWAYDGFGDARVLARYQGTHEPTGPGWGLHAGLKLPTGRHDVANDEGEVAERTLQPGTGTTDGIAGVHYHHGLDSLDMFVQAQYQFALNKIDAYKPGSRLAVDLGMRYPLTDAVAVLAQVNFLRRGRDSGDEAEPEDAGAHFLFFSPGLSVALSPQARVYGFVQVPLWQHVNGVQLTADWAASVGISLRF